MIAAKKVITSLVGCLAMGLRAAAQAAPFAYVSNSGGNSISVIDTASNTVVTTIGSGGVAPGPLAVNPARHAPVCGQYNQQQRFSDRYCFKGCRGYDPYQWRISSAHWLSREPGRDPLVRDR